MLSNVVLGIYDHFALNEFCFIGMARLPMVNLIESISTLTFHTYYVEVAGWGPFCHRGALDVFCRKVIGHPMSEVEVRIR